MTKVVNANDGRLYFLLHHEVLKDQSFTNKPRMFFDVSTRTAQCLPFNDSQMIKSE